MATKSLEQLEAEHTARAERKGLAMPEQEESVDDDMSFLDDTTETNSEPNPYEEEINRLRQQLAATQGRVAPEQQRAEEYRQMAEAEQRARQAEARQLQEEIAALREQLEEKQSEVNVVELLSDDERDMFDPVQLTAIAKIADELAKRRAPRIDARAEALAAIRERERQQIEDYRNRALTDPARGVSSLSILAHDPEFQAWLDKEENDDFDVLVNSMLQADTKEVIDRRVKAVAKRIAAFKQQGKTQKAAPRPTDPQQSLNSAMQRRPRRMSDEETNRKIAEASRLARSRNAADRARAQQILDSI